MSYHGPFGRARASTMMFEAGRGSSDDLTPARKCASRVRQGRRGAPCWRKSARPTPCKGAQPARLAITLSLSSLLRGNMWPFACCQVCRPAERAPAAPETPPKEEAPSTPPQSLELIRAHSRAGSRILLHSSDGLGSRNRSAPSQSLLEASARRLASVTETDGAHEEDWDVEPQGIPQKFYELYFKAIQEENEKYVELLERVMCLFLSCVDRRRRLS